MATARYGDTNYQLHVQARVPGLSCVAFLYKVCVCSLKKKKTHKIHIQYVFTTFLSFVLVKALSENWHLFCCCCFPNCLLHEGMEGWGGKATWCGSYIQQGKAVEDQVSQEQLLSSGWNTRSDVIVGIVCHPYYYSTGNWGTNSPRHYSEWETKCAQPD